MDNILDYSLKDLEQWFSRSGKRDFRARQVWQWLWAKQVRDFDSMSNVSRELRNELSRDFSIDWPAVDLVQTSSDGVVKFLLRLSDQEKIETVLIPEKNHYTLCISTQVGCAMGCTFCSTGRMGFTRNLSPAEICGQILTARDYLARTDNPLALRNIVVMGMGEPLLNLPNLLAGLEVMVHPLGLDFSPRRVTVSTVGLAKGLDELGRSENCSLAVSLHAPTQELREKIMPKAARLHIFDLIDILNNYPLKSRQRLTFEYILIKDVNDRPEHARQLVKLLSRYKGKKPKINLIAYNPPRSQLNPFGYKAPGPDRILAFEKILWAKDMTVILRKSKGADIDAACGQLKAERA